MFPFQGLHTGQFVGAYRPFRLRGACLSLTIGATDSLQLGLDVGILRRQQPVADAVRLERPL